LLGMAPSSPTACPRSHDYREHYEALTGCSLKQCPICHRGTMVCLEVIPATSRPQRWDTS
jgi:hypothetical protein